MIGVRESVETRMKRNSKRNLGKAVEVEEWNSSQGIIQEVRTDGAVVNAHDFMRHVVQVRDKERVKNRLRVYFLIYLVF